MDGFTMGFIFLVSVAVIFMVLNFRESRREAEKRGMTLKEYVHRPLTDEEIKAEEGRKRELEEAMDVHTSGRYAYHPFNIEEDR